MAFMSRSTATLLGTAGLGTGMIAVSVVAVGDLESYVDEFYAEQAVIDDRMGGDVYWDPIVQPMITDLFPDNPYAWYSSGHKRVWEALRIANPTARNSLLDDAISDLEQSLRLKETNRAHHTLGKASARKGDFATGRAHLESAYGNLSSFLNPKTIRHKGNIANWLAYIALCQNDHEALEKYSEAAIDLGNDHPSNHTYRGIAHLTQGELIRARLEFRKAREGFEGMKAKNDHDRWVLFRHEAMIFTGFGQLGDEELGEYGKKLAWDAADARYIDNVDAERATKIYVTPDG